MMRNGEMAQSTEKDQKRIRSLDGLRGVACLAVLLLHIGLMTQPFGPDANYDLSPGVPAVMVFYVLSGVVLSLVPLKKLRANGYDWFAYYPRRVVRLCVPLFAAILIGVIAGFVGYSLGSDARSATAIDYTGGLSVIIHDLFMQFDILFNVSDNGLTLHGQPLHRVDSPVWSMSWELWFSILLPLCIFLVMIARRQRLLVLALFACVFLAHYSGYFPLRFGIMFIFGVIIAKRYEAHAARQLPWPAEAVALIVCLALIEVPSLGDYGELANAFAQTVMNAACVCLVLLALSNGFVRRALSARPCLWLGKISYSMYLTHAIVIGALGSVLPMLGLSALACAAVALVASFVFAWLFWRFIEDPSIRWSHSIGKLANSLRS